MGKKVLIVANDFTTVYNFRLELIAFLLKKSIKVVIALPCDERTKKLTDMGAQVVDLQMNRFGTNPLQDIRTMFHIKSIIAQTSPDIVFTYTAKPNIYGGIACALTQTPFVANVTGLGANFEKKNLISKIMLVLQKISFRKARMVFFQNESNLAFFRERNIVGNNYGRLPGSGVNLKTNPFEEYPKAETVRFLTIARVRKDKGYDELFYAIKKAIDRKLPAEFHIIGWYEDDAYRQTVEAFQKFDNVVFHNGVPHEEVHQMIKDSACLIHPSHHEGMSNVVLEAAAAGRPAIVSRIPGCAEAVDDGETGYYFEVKDQEDLYRKIETFMGLTLEERKELGKKARKKIEKEYDRQIVIDEYYRLIE